MERKFAFVAEGDVFMVMSFDDTDPENMDPARFQMILAGMASNPQVVEFMPDQDIGEGWRHDGIGFIRPKE